MIVPQHMVGRFTRGIIRFFNVAEMLSSGDRQLIALLIQCDFDIDAILM